MANRPVVRIGYAPGAPVAVLTGVEPLTPETFDPLTATEETERAQADINQRLYEANMRQLVEQAGLTFFEKGDN